MKILNVKEAGVECLLLSLSTSDKKMSPAFFKLSQSSAPMMTYVLFFILFGVLVCQPAFCQDRTTASGSWSWPKIKVPDLSSFSVSLPLNIASLGINLPDSQDFSDALASGVVKGLVSFRQVASAAFEMARDDLDKHATWHYRVVDFENAAMPEELEQKLTELGKEKWELVSITPLPTKNRFYFKKRGISLLRLLAPVFDPEK